MWLFAELLDSVDISGSLPEWTDLEIPELPAEDDISALATKLGETLDI